MKRLLLLGPLLLLLSASVLACAGATPTSPTVDAPIPSQPQSASRPSASPSSSQSVSDAADSDVSVLQIQPGASTATFTLDEILRGSPNTVIGTTDKVAGEIALDPDEPGATKVGTITVDARTLATGNTQRNNMLHRFILATSQFEHVTFTPTTITGLPATIELLGIPYPVKIDGKLTIKDVTRDVTFDASVTPLSFQELRGTATTTISQQDFGITIPSIPFVGGVSDEVRLDLHFVAIA
jgi:polyisoprenoid-binding protein YceI